MHPYEFSRLAQQGKPIPLRQLQFQQLRDLVYSTTGISLADNKQTFVQSRLARRLRHLRLSSFQEYLKYLESCDDSGEELQQFINRITTNKTHFFRENYHFEHLRETVFPRLIDEAERGRRPRKLRIWSSASSTGEEPYSLAMTVLETFENRPDWDVRILASDIDTEVLNRASSGIYPASSVDTLPAHTIEKYFERGTGEDRDKVMIGSHVSDLVTFRQINLMDEHWPIHGPFDIIFCRNVLIYFDQIRHDQLMRHMARMLAADGRLFIGYSESLSRLSDVYTKVGRTIYSLTPGFTDTRPNTIAVRKPTDTSAKGRSSEVAEKSIIVGGVCACDRPTRIRTVLGSCVAACLFDEQTGVGGMNHFALPVGNSDSRTAASFGVHAMELLINSIMKKGGDRRRLKAKLFGGAHVLQSAEKIGEKNIRFIHEFLNTESIPVEAEYLGGYAAMQVWFETHTQRVRVKLLEKSAVAEEERRIHLTQQVASEESVASNITLF